MPLRAAVYSDLVPASKLLAAAFHDDEIFGAYIHPKRNEYPEDASLYHLRWLREAYFTPEEYLIVSYDDSNEAKITGLAHWMRYHSTPQPEPWLPQITVKLIEFYNHLESYIYPNRAIDPIHEQVLPLGYPYYSHQWTGTRADCWHLSLLGVDPSAMKRGFGRELVAWGFERSKRENVSVSVVSVPGQERFYRACGFDTFVGTMNDGGGEDNPSLRAGFHPAPILFCDHGRAVVGVKKYGEE